MHSDSIGTVVASPLNSRGDGSSQQRPKDRPSASAVRETAPAQTRRRHYVDVFRGLLIAHMALDHASLFFNAGRGGEELAAAAPAAPADFLQFLTRFTGIPVAPGFFFMAGFMVALTSLAREARGVAPGEITRRLILRGLVLIAVDAFIMGLPRALMGFYSFMVLSAIGASLILLALIRHLSNWLLLSAALGMLVLHPLLDVSGLPLAIRAVLYEPVREGAFRSLYPLVPWCAMLVLGYVVGRDAASRARPARFWMMLAGASLLVFLAVRLVAGYGNAYAHGGIANLDFWFFAKYPPDLPFLAWSCAMIFLTLAALWRITRDSTPTLLRPLAVFGRVSFFFYVVHFYLLGVAAAIARTKLDLAATYGVWLLLLAVMLWPCLWYERKKRERPNFITRYL